MADVPLPAWVKEIRPHQQDAVDEAIELYKQGIQVVMMDAPTGSGKTLIAELIRRRLDDEKLSARALYVCSDKALMRQAANDFPYAKMLMGKANYPTQNDPSMSADDCTARGPDDACWFCDDGHGSCPYQLAKVEAMRAKLAITNTSFLLTEANYVGRFSNQPFIIADEADTLEGMLMGFVEYNVSDRRIKEFGMETPGKGVHKATLVKWLQEFQSVVTKASMKLAVKNDPANMKAMRRLMALAGETERVASEFIKEIARKQDGENEGRWLRDYNDRTGGLILKPVMVDSYGTRQLWRHGKRWLLMSATIISSDEMADSLGLPLSYATVEVPMTFPVENRPVILAPVANVVYKEMHIAVPRLVKAIVAVIHKHPEDRVLVHTVSYKLAKDLSEGVRQALRGTDQERRPLLTYSEGRDKDATLDRYKKQKAAVMFAPSMGRGVDLPGDLCRVQVIAKVPFLSLGDTQVSRRIHMPGGDTWYAVQAVRDVVQMTGRGVRSKDDHAVTYIFDQQFASNLWRKHKGLFPAWWRESVITNRSAKEFM